MKEPDREPSNPAEQLGDFTTDTRTVALSAIAVVIGGIAAGVADALLKLIALFTNLFFFQRFTFDAVTPGEHRLGVLAVLVPVLGALIIGLMARFGSERIRGHGIPEALESILIKGSRVEPRLALLKPISSAISIGSGGPFGAEGPIILTGGAFGSLVAQAFHLTSAERKTLLVAGAAGGMSATFGSPIAATMLAVELMLFEWKPRSFIPVALASATAMAARSYIFGSDALFQVAPHGQITGAAALEGGAVVGVTAGVLATAMTASVYFFEDAFKRLPVHWMWWPAIGAIAIGVGGLIEPQALGVGYETLAALLDGHMAVAAIAVLVIVKWSIWSIALGSGTSGGVLAPLLMIGGALGGIEGHFLPGGASGLWALVGMGAILGGTMRSPFTGVVFAFEITHDVGALLPLLVAVTVAHCFTVLLLKRSILTEKVARRGFHVTREYAIDPLEVLFVREVMQARPAEACTAGVTAFPDETLRTATLKMAAEHTTSLPVVDRKAPTVALGELVLGDVLLARRRHLEEETRRERTLGFGLSR